MASDLDTLVRTLIEGEREQALKIVSDLVNKGMSSVDIVTGGIEEAMVELDTKCTVEQFNLLEIMLAGRAVMAVIHHLFPVDDELPVPRGSVVVAVLKGDIHDIGKAILKVLLVGSHFQPIDCGKDVPVAAVVGAAARSGAPAVCVSGLISSVIPQVRALKPALARAGLAHVRVLAGGAALKQCSAAALNVDHVGQTAFDAIAYLDSMGEARDG
ncbi:MAG TPA: cobalamin-dependent protein [Anaeromyxobacteraceae bacterium]|nr:cobalamin-dependent protein [Anaeromyxobacteraceae bacterium]